MFDFIIGDAAETEYIVPTGPIVPEPIDCMRCGICLSTCPTYQLTQDEQESPKQRIRTLNKLVLEDEPVDDNAITHLSNCMQCRACEAICPSQMSYSVLFDQAQHQLAKKQPKGFLAKLALTLIADKKRLHRMLPVIRLYHASGMRWLAQTSGLLKRLKLDIADSMARVPKLQALNTQYTPSKAVNGTVALFTGCLSAHFDRKTVDATIKILNALGYQVVIPEEQACCGAIHHHNGEPDTAKALMQQNRSCFNALTVEAVIYCVSGCGSQLHEYDTALALAEDEAAFTPPLYEVMDFIAHHWDENIPMKSATKKIVVHEPCSHRNVLKSQQSIYDVLRKIPSLQVEALAENQTCCGAGGSYMLTHPETAQTLRDQKCQHIKAANVSEVVTTNIGCGLHLKTGLLATDDVQIKHPICVLAEQLA